MLIIEIIDVRTSEENPPTSKMSSGRAAIISRMAKMGQSILPKMPLPSTTDSEDTEVLFDIQTVKTNVHEFVKLIIHVIVLI